MSPKERQTPEERRKEWNAALAGVFRGYSLRTSSPDIIQSQIELRNGEKKKFLIFGAFGEEGNTYKPEVLVISSLDTNVRVAARAIWNGDWPEVVDTDVIGGTVTITGKLADTRKDSISVSEAIVEEHDVPGDELLEVVNKLALSLRFPDSD